MTFRSASAADAGPGRIELFGPRARFSADAHHRARRGIPGARTDQPDRRDRHSGAARPAALGALPHPRRRGARRHLDPGRARGDARRHGRGRAQGKPGAAVQQCRCRPCGQRVSRRRGARGDLLRLADRPARAQEAVLHHAHRLPAGDGGDRVLVESVELPPLPLHHRRGHRRRICGDQFDHPGAGPGARARLDRPRDQRLVLDRRGARRTRGDRAARPRRDRSRAWLARRVPDRRAAGRHRVLHAAVAAGKPALADDPWPRRRGRGRGRRHRATAARGRACDRAGPAAEGPSQEQNPHAARRRGAHTDPPASAAHAGRARPDGGAGVLLQRDLLHLCAGADHVLRHPVAAGRLVHPAVRGRQRARVPCCSGGCSTRSAGGR